MTKPGPMKIDDLAELDLLALVDVARGAQDDEGDAALVLLDLRAQVEALRVLDGELVQAEDVAARRVELLRRRLDHAEPHEARVAPADRRGLGGSIVPSCCRRPSR